MAVPLPVGHRLAHLGLRYGSTVKKAASWWPLIMEKTPTHRPIQVSVAIHEEEAGGTVVQVRLYQVHS